MMMAAADILHPYEQRAIRREGTWILRCTITRDDFRDIAKLKLRMAVHSATASRIVSASSSIFRRISASIPRNSSRIFSRSRCSTFARFCGRRRLALRQKSAVRMASASANRRFLAQPGITR